MPRTLTITRASDDSSLYDTLQQALKLLESAGVQTEGAAQTVEQGVPTTATILLHSPGDKSRAIGILERAGIVIEK